MPSERALRNAATLRKRLQGRSAKVRLDFVRTDTEGVVPLLAYLLRGGRGGEVRLKLFLSLLWVAGGGTDDRHKTHAYPARSWAGLLDLDDPEGNGQRRIRDALKWLDDQQLVKIEREPGHPMVLQLRREDGSGKNYTDPGGNARQKKSKKEDVSQDDLFLQLPSSFWTDGWLASLSGRAIAMLLVLGEATFWATQEFPWVSPSLARSRYGLSEDTWSKGMRELREHEIIQIRKKPVGEDDFDIIRTRNTFRLPMEKGLIQLPPGG
jgi:hypothetical protein